MTYICNTNISYSLLMSRIQCLTMVMKHADPGFLSFYWSEQIGSPRLGFC